MISTVSGSQQEILQNIQTLHNQGKPLQADLTWGSGGCWKGIDAPRIRSDLVAGRDTNLVADARALPFRPGSLKSVLVDFPFIHAPGKNSIMGQRFSGYRTQDALHEMYKHASGQIIQALAPGGLLVWKVQDIVESGKQVWNHIRVYHLLTLGIHAPMRVEDLFILTAKNRPAAWNSKRQLHARKYHSYFWVARREA